MILAFIPYKELEKEDAGQVLTRQLALADGEVLHIISQEDDPEGDRLAVRYEIQHTANYTGEVSNSELVALAKKFMQDKKDGKHQENPA